MHSRLMAGTAFLLGILGVSLGLRLSTLEAAPAAGDGSEGYSDIAVFTRAMQLIRQDYVDGEKVDFHDLTYSALRGMLSSLDPHSQFMEPEDFLGMQDDTRSQFGGLGIVVSVKDGVLTIIAPMEDTPGFRAGLLPGDQILKVDGVPTEKLDLTDAISQLRGSPGDKISLTILRPATKEIKTYDLEREVIKVASVKDAQILPAELTSDFKIGYVRLTQFNDPTARDLREQLAGLEKKGMQALVLDLRFNPGGLLNSAVDVCAQFLPPDQMVVYTEGRTPSQKKVYRTPSNAKSWAKYPVAVLVNGGSASGAEIVAGALKDLGRAVVVGETTFGKGSVQSVIQLPDGSALRLTTAKYYTPGKQVIHEHGVKPNIRATMTAEQERKLVLKRREEVLDVSDRMQIADFRDTQLERATDALKGAMIYAGRASDAKSGTRAN